MQDTVRRTITVCHMTPRERGAGFQARVFTGKMPVPRGEVRVFTGFTPLPHRLDELLQRADSRFASIGIDDTIDPDDRDH